MKSFLPASYNAATQILIAPLVGSLHGRVSDPGRRRQRGALSSGVNWGIRPAPDGDGKIRPARGDRPRHAPGAVDRAPTRAANLGRARDGGRRRVRGAFDRYLRAYDAADGTVLWEKRLNDVSSSSPITFSLDGKQYVAIVTGQGGFHAASSRALVPELKSPPDRGAAIWVFALPN